MKPALNANLFSSICDFFSRHTPDPQQPSYALNVEELEDRQMLSTVSFNDGTLLIAGSQTESSSISIIESADGYVNVSTSLTDEVERFRALEIREIRIIGRGFNDQVSVAQPVDFATNLKNLESIYFNGQDGNDWLLFNIEGVEATVTAFGGKGNDIIRLHEMSAISDGPGGPVDAGDVEVEPLRPFQGIIRGGMGDDLITGTLGRDFIAAGPGRDQVHGADGDDRIEGGAGDDVLEGGNGADRVFGGDGNDKVGFGFFFSPVPTVDSPIGDFMSGGRGNDEIRGTFGDDLIYGGAGTDIIDAKEGDDVVLAGDGRDTIEGGFGDDRILGQAGIDDITGGNGKDQLNGGAGRDRIDGGRGADLITGGADIDTLRGGTGEDLIRGGSSADIIYGDSGNDIIRGDVGNDTVYGGTGDDLIVGGEGNDRLYGEIGNDRLIGSVGDDRLFGNDGNDRLFGGDGADTLKGQSGRDRLDSGAGEDIIVYPTSEDVSVNVDLLLDTVTILPEREDYLGLTPDEAVALATANSQSYRIILEDGTTIQGDGEPIAPRFILEVRGGTIWRVNNGVETLSADQYRGLPLADAIALADRYGRDFRIVNVGVDPTPEPETVARRFTFHVAGGKVAMIKMGVRLFSGGNLEILTYDAELEDYVGLTEFEATELARLNGRTARTLTFTLTDGIVTRVDQVNSDSYSVDDIPDELR